MKQIKIFELAEQVKYLSIAELRYVLNQHGGSYDWRAYDEDKDKIVDYEERPIIHYESGFAEVANVYVNGVHINEKGVIVVDMEDKYENDLSCAVYDLEPRHIRCITAYIDNSEVGTPVYTERVNALIDKFVRDLGKVNQQYLTNE